MTYSERKEKEKHLLYLIQEGRLSSLEKVAENYGCSAKTIQRMINDLRYEGNEIYYCRKTFKYYINN